MAQQVDVVVIGTGVGGEEVAGKLAEAGLSVVAVESTLVGGECPYWGCVPSKMMIRAANLLAEARRLDGIAGHADVTPEWEQVATRIREEATADWNDQAAVDRFTGKGGLLVRGSGRLAGPDLVVVNGETFEARRGVVLATGTVPVVPPIDGLTDTPYWTNREAIEAKSFPASLIVLGGGAVGLELAQVYARFGVAVTIVEAMDRLLPAEEPEASALVERALVADGITVRVGAPAAAVRYDGTRFSVAVGDRESTAERISLALASIRWAWIR
jgi:pyruvate/2-oxoglutarate dehydrogenase complex dihydrolipoamide dehydrogenase (E3) component